MTLEGGYMGNASRRHIFKYFFIIRDRDDREEKKKGYIIVIGGESEGKEQRLPKSIQGSTPVSIFYVSEKLFNGRL